MEHGSPFGHTRLPSPWFWLAVALAVATIVLGTLAHVQHAPAGLHGATRSPGGEPHADWSSAIYHGVQLLVLHSPHVEGHVPGLLHVARWLGAAFFFLAGALAFAKLFRREARLLQLQMPWRQRHVVVCGLGDLGLRLALDGRARGRFVVAIEQRGALPAVDEAREHGVLVLEGDACDPAVLRKARVGRAELLVAACDADHTSVAVAAAVAPLVAGAHRRTPLVCRLLIRDGATRAMLAAHPFFSHAAAGYRVNVSDLDYCDTAARQALRRHPLDHRPVRAADATVVRLAVVGCGAMGRGLARHAARIGHFANEAARGVRLAITMVDREPGPGWSAFEAPLAAVCAIEFQAIDPESPELVERLAALAANDALLTCAACVETHREVGPDDATNFRIGVELARRLAGRPAQVLTFQRTNEGFAALLAAEQRAGLALELHPFGMVEGVYDWDVLLHESEDALARALHEDFLQQRAKGGGPAPLPPWDELSDSLKDSNRQAADHIAIKLRAVGYHVRPLEPGRPRVERFTDEETLLMAKMEHARWCAERTLDGWTLGTPSNADRRVNANLVPWDRLDPAERQKDPEQVLAIPGALLRLGRGIYR